MKYSISICIVLAIGVILSGCSNEEETPPISSKPKQDTSASRLSEPVYIHAQGQLTYDKRVLVTGETNLPDKTILLISLINEATGFQAQDKISISAGKYSSNPLGPKSGLTPGNYTIEVLMPISSTQPEGVQKTIGNNGQNLFGSLVVESFLGKAVEYSTLFTVGTPEDISAIQKKNTELVTSIRTSLENLLEAGRSMEKHRNSDNLTDARICGELMRANQVSAKSVHSRSEKLSFKYLSLKAATIDIHSCVSCSLSAEDACVRVEEYLLQY